MEGSQVKCNMAFTVHKSGSNVDVVFSNPAASQSPQIDSRPEGTTTCVGHPRLKWVILSLSILVVILLIGLPILAWKIGKNSKRFILTYFSSLHLIARTMSSQMME